MDMEKHIVYSIETVDRLPAAPGSGFARVTHSVEYQAQGFSSLTFKCICEEEQEVGSGHWATGPQLQSLLVRKTHLTSNNPGSGSV